jgi:hypothetical protein
VIDHEKQKAQFALGGGHSDARTHTRDVTSDESAGALTRFDRSKPFGSRSDCSHGVHHSMVRRPAR